MDSPGLGLLTGEAGVGKTAALRALTQSLNPHRYQVIYLAETDFGRLDLYRALALALGLEPAYRRAQLWRDIEARITELMDTQHVLPLWVLDEAQNLPKDFFRDFPAFLNFAFDSRDLMTVWLVGHPILAQTLQPRPLCTARQPPASAHAARGHHGAGTVRRADQACPERGRLRAHAALGLRARDPAPRFPGPAPHRRPHPEDRHAARRAQGTQPPARRPAATSHRGAAMNEDPPNLLASLPTDLSDEAAWVLFELLQELPLAFECQYSRQLRRYARARWPAEKPPEAPWITDDPPF